MQLRESIKNTKKFLHKTLQNLKSLIVGGYQKLPKPTSIKFCPLSCRSIKTKRNNQTDVQYYSHFCTEWECDLEKAMKGMNRSVVVSEGPILREEGAYNGSSMEGLPLKKKEVEGNEDHRNKKSTHLREGEEKCSKNINGEGYALAKKMKELEVMDGSDVEHVLDVEEAIHYYSLLKSPVYLDIVDKFFSDMYTEFSVPQASVSINNSKRRLRSIRL